MTVFASHASTADYVHLFDTTRERLLDGDVEEAMACFESDLDALRRMTTSEEWRRLRVQASASHPVRGLLHE